MSEAPTVVVAISLAAGMATQLLAIHSRVPGILLLLMMGVLLGPDVLGWVEPRALGSGLASIVDFAVAIVLFEGSLNLNLTRLTHQALPIQRLVTVGIVVAGVGITLASHWILGWSFRLCGLFAALTVVTGPTVINPLLKRVRVDASVATVLEAEGIFVDAIGAVLAMVALEVVLTAPGVEWGPIQFLTRVGLGALTGGAGGLVIIAMFRNRSVVPRGLENVSTLALAVLLFVVSNRIMGQSGIAAVIAAGMVVGSRRPRLWRKLHDFKEQLTVLLLGLVFILLAASVRVKDIVGLGWAGFGAVAAIVFVVRPISVFAATIRTGLSWQQRTFIAAMGPRGIIAAAVAAYFGSALARRGIAGGVQLEALVFLLIATSVVSASVLCHPLSKLLGLELDTRDGFVIFGANPLALFVARLLDRSGQSVLCVDSDPDACRAAESAGLRVAHGNVMDEITLRRLDVGRRAGVIALTKNDGMNFLFAERVRELSAETPILVALSASDSKITAEMLELVGAQLFSGVRFDVGRWSRWIDEGSTDLVKCLPEEAATIRPAGLGSHAERLALPLVGIETRGARPYDGVTSRSLTSVYALLFARRTSDAVDSLRERGLVTELRKSLSSTLESTGMKATTLLFAVLISGFGISQTGCDLDGTSGSSGTGGAVDSGAGGSCGGSGGSAGIGGSAAGGSGGEDTGGFAGLTGLGGVGGGFAGQPGFGGFGGGAGFGLSGFAGSF